ncbi:hypothetical protein RsS62_65500 [Rhizobium dioscoreae]|uniref:hypothetical protein n=1 Tax=Rhizobium TaxID=379 RepID=UPI00126082F5|nr:MULTISPECIES: hypothetical protein [Rhizobium]MCZ3380666.1 hypothetical protein [Rhizobium sp. AG207R]GES47298.1 hypothetical protein RsS62_65500 [Rhizobium dioscoreae]
MNQLKTISPAETFGFDFVQLGRTFHELSKYASEDDSIDAGRAFHVGHRLSWGDLVNEYRLVILAEAGSGKTAEIRSIAQTLRSEGKRAFFLRLENIPRDFEFAFEVGTYPEFCAWLKGNEEGWLLLDSVDEARLRNPRDFELAITKLGAVIGTAKIRAHIIITGRTTAWRPKTDLMHCIAHLPYAAPVAVQKTQEKRDDAEFGDLEDAIQTETRDKGNDGAPGFKIVTLSDLSAEQIALFIAARGVTNTKAFLNAVERADAWSFTTRPQDLEDLTAFWLANERTGSRLEIMRNSIERRLSERDQGRAEARPLAMERAREGAMLLAAAATLSKDPAIRVPDGADNTKGIPVKSVLPDWDEAQQAALLARPIFDEAIYGVVRFHHRSVREYLAAEWFAKLLARETSRRSIEAMFFREQYGTLIVTPTLRPILPWLALLDGKIRDRIKQIAPEIALEGGDPSQLPITDRRQILHDVCAQVAAGTSSRSIHDYAAVQRFANADLTDDIRALIRSHASNDDLSSFLLRMVWLGQLEGALPEVLEIALSNGAEEYSRQNAFRALKAIGSEADQRRVRDEFISQENELNRTLLAELVEDLAPNLENLEWFLRAIGRSQPKEPYSVDGLSEQLKSFVQRAPLDVVHALAVGLLPILSQPPVIERRLNNVSQRFEWLLPSASKAVERLISVRHPSAFEPACFTIMRMISGARAYQSDEISDEKTNFAELISSWAELNRAFFWFEVQQTRESTEQKGERLTDFWHASIFGTFWAFGESDFDYVSGEIANQKEQDNKLVALSLAFDLYRRFGRPRVWREKLKKLVAGNDELVARLNTFLKPPAQPETRRWRAQERQWKKQREAHKATRAKYHERWKAYLEKELESLRASQKAKPGEMLNATLYLFKCSHDDRHVGGKWTGYNWHQLIAKFGEPIARFYRDSAVEFWRHHAPTLQSEGAPNNQTSYATIFGLVGLEIEFHESPGWPSALSPSEVERACRYASFELNGFPSWFPKLFETDPATVTAFLLGEIRYELSNEKADVDGNYIISDVSWSGQWCWDQLAPQLYGLMQTVEPVNLNNLGKLLKILQGSSISDADLGALAATKCAALGDSTNAAFWFAAWTGVAPHDAIPALSAHLDAINDTEKRIEFAMNYVTHLFSGRRGEDGAARGAFHTPSYLKSLYLLISQHVKREDDIERAGSGVYSPGLRDNAQDARNHLVDVLLKTSGKETFLAIHEIAEAFPERPWLARFAKERAERDGDLDAIPPAGVRELNDKLERTPTNHRELAELAVLRLNDLKDDLENGDSSIAAILRTVKLETDMRKYIGKELRDKAFGRYAIPQEEELADAKKPDLRFHGIGFDGPVPGELKLADKWSGPDLFERLENQLCGDYLRDNRSNRGIFALVQKGEKTSWDLPGKLGRVDFDGLVVALQQKWLELSPRYPGIDNITVIGIDLTKRDKKGAHSHT